MRKIYLASSWRNNIQPTVLERLREEGHQVYDFRNPGPEDDGFHWSEIDPNWKGWNNPQYLRALQSPIAARGFANDWNAMRAADTCVLLLPCGRSAHLEAGYFVGARKELHILLLVPIEPELMYNMATKIHTSMDTLCLALK